MIILDTLVIGGLKFILRRLAEAVDAELNDVDAIRQELLAAQMRLELGELTADQFAEVVATVTGLRHDVAAPFDFVVGLPLGVDPMPYAAAGATWWLPEFEPETVSLDQVRGVLRDGPATS